jgi:hypothetical protein
VLLKIEGNNLKRQVYWESAEEKKDVAAVAAER